jgi:hypothetical protein
MAGRVQLDEIQVNRSELRQNQSALLKKARGRTVVVVTARSEDEEKCVVDRKYFEQILERLRTAIETLEITTDPKLFGQLLRAAETVDEDIRLGRLRSFEEAFGER